MSEVKLQPGPEQSAFQPSFEKVEKMKPAIVIEKLEAKGIEVKEREATEAALSIIQSEFGLSDEAFEDFKRTVVLTAAAERLAQLERSQVDAGVYGSELEYIADVVMDIAGNYTVYKDELDIKKSAKEVQFTDEHTKKVYEKFTQPELTKELQLFMQGQEFDDLRRRLGVVEEMPFKLKVLSIDTGDTSGLAPYVDFSEPGDFEAYKQKMKESEYRRDYVDGLGVNARRFAQELGREEVFAPAWVTTFEDGEQFLCVSSALAEKIMYTDEERPNPNYNTEQRPYDLATLEHEYTHTQGMITEGHIGLGIALEELRAEHFSGNKQGYTDIKRYFAGMKMLTGYNPASSFEIEGRPYNQDEFLADIARNVGLAGLLDAMAAIPKNYVEDEDASPHVKAIVAHNGGGLSGQFERLYRRLAAEQGPDVVEARISAFVDNVREVLKGNEYVTVESWFAYGRIDSLMQIGIKNFRDRYPEESDNYDYF